MVVEENDGKHFGMKWSRLARKSQVQVPSSIRVGVHVLSLSCLTT